jgi:hypothetical protein
MNYLKSFVVTVAIFVGIFWLLHKINSSLVLPKQEKTLPFNLTIYNQPTQPKKIIKLKKTDRKKVVKKIRTKKIKAKSIKAKK